MDQCLDLIVGFNFFLPNRIKNIYDFTHKQTFSNKIESAVLAHNWTKEETHEIVNCKRSFLSKRGTIYLFVT